MSQGNEEKSNLINKPKIVICTRKLLWLKVWAHISSLFPIFLVRRKDLSRCLVVYINRRLYIVVVIFWCNGFLLTKGDYFDQCIFPWLKFKTSFHQYSMLPSPCLQILLHVVGSPVQDMGMIWKNRICSRYMNH